MAENQLTIFDILDERKPSERILVEEDFDWAKRNPRFIYYLLAAGKRVGDGWEVYEFQIWISQRVREFKTMNGFQENSPNSHIPDFHKRLSAYMQNYSGLSES